VTPVQLAQVKADLRRYLRAKDSLFSPEFSAVVADVATFVSAILRDGLDQAIAQLPKTSKGLSDRPLIEVADVIVEHHLRFAKDEDREVIRKSLLEAYIHAAGPQYVFERPAKTRLGRSLHHSGVVNFAALLFSLHTFNLVGMAIQDKLRAEMPDVKRFELFMLAVEGICRNVVEAAIQTQRASLDEKWAKAVAKTIEAEILQLREKKTKPHQHPIISGHKK
jgi:hypothetical protein